MAGETLFKQGENGDKMYIVQEGEIDLYLLDMTIETVGPGGILGELALIDNRPRTATAIARTECKVVEIDSDRFTFLVQETPFFALDVMTVMADRLRYMDRHATESYTPYDMTDG